MWMRVMYEGKAIYRLIHLESGNRIDVVADHAHWCVRMYVSHGLSYFNNRPDTDVHDLALGTEVECRALFETICQALAQQGQLVSSGGQHV